MEVKMNNTRYASHNWPLLLAPSTTEVIDGLVREGSIDLDAPRAARTVVRTLGWGSHYTARLLSTLDATVYEHQTGDPF